MPALPSVSQVMRFDIHHSLVSDTNVSSRLFFSYTGGPPDGAQAATIAQDVEEAYGTHLITLLPEAYSVIEVVATDLNLPDGARGVYTSSSAGTRAGTSLSDNIAACVVHTIDRRYRGGKPKNFFPWGVQADLASGQEWGSSFQSEVGTKFAAFVANIIAFSGVGVTFSEHVAVSYYSGFTTYTGSGGRPKTRATLRATPLQDAITESAMALTLGSQRRRLRAA